MNEKISLLNKIMEEGYCGPTSLFKYRPFDKYTFDMLENNYLFLCAAENLDDKRECETTIDINRYIDVITNNAKTEAVNQIIEMIKPHTSNENYEMVKAKIHSISRNNGTVKPNFLLDIIFDIEKMVPNYDIAPFVNWIVGIPEKLDDPIIKPQLETLKKIKKK